ncbi:MAG: (d)CMP kinase [bacterium]|nr:(d)CMP kinase [bacterium]
MPYARTIAIDGPAASGKSTLGATLAETLGYVFVDAGMIYRALTGEILNAGLDPRDERSIVAFAQALPVRFDGATVSINGQPFGANLHSSDISRTVPTVAAYGGVRAAIRTYQRQIAGQGAVVFAGRDIGTVVLPNADLKLYLDVSLDERARRRHLSLRVNNPLLTLEQVRHELHQRDQLDTQRHESPLKIADDAFVIRTDGLSPAEVLDVALGYAKRQSA